jgi:outer membrane protein OmpA-like peptidoglycan-associated protein
MRKQMSALTVLLVALMLASGCVATRKFTRNEVKTSADQLSARIDTDESNAKELKDHLDRVATQGDQNTKNIASVKEDVTKVDSKADAARNDAQRAQTTADGAVTKTATLDKNLVALDTTLNRKIDNLNNYSVVTEKTVYFGFNSASPSGSMDEALTEVTKLMQENKSAIILLEGHTDSTGADTYNVSLADKRADAVLRHLVVDMKLPMYRIFKMGYGEANPVAPNDSKTDREKNRCVVIRVLTAQVNG